MIALKLILVLSLAFTLSGCIVSFTNPLPASQKFARDDRLAGRWRVTDDQGIAHFAVFEKHSDREMTLSLPGHFLGTENPQFRMSTTKISGKDYMTLRMDDPNSRDDYLIARYSLEGAALTVCILDTNRVVEAIKQRKLKGSFGYSPWGAAVITESANGVLSFLKSGETDAMFICPSEFNLKRVTD